MSVQVKSPGKLPEIVRRAFRVACSGKPGAVHLQIQDRSAFSSPAST